MLSQPQETLELQQHKQSKVCRFLYFSIALLLIFENFTLRFVELTRLTYLTDSCIGFTLKMESVPKNTFFGLKMMVKSGLEKFILKSLHAGRFLLLNLSFWTLL